MCAECMMIDGYQIDSNLCKSKKYMAVTDIEIAFIGYLGPL